MIWKGCSFLLDSSLKRLLSASLFLSCMEVVPVLGVTFFVQQALNRAVLHRDPSLLLWDGAAMIGCTLWISLIALINSRIALKANQKMGKKIYEKIIERSLGSSYLGKEDISDRGVIYDADQFHSMGTLLLIRSLPAAFVSIAIGLFLFFLQPVLASFLFIAIPLFFLSFHSLEKKVRQLGAVHQEAHERFGSGIRFLFEKIDLIQTQTAEAAEEIKQKHNLKEMGRALRSFIWVQTLYQLSQNFLIASISIFVLVAGGKLVIDEKMPFSHLITFYIALGMLKRYIQSLIASFPILVQGTVSLKRLDEFLKKPNTSPHSGSKRIGFQGELRLENVSFRFGKEPLVENCSFSVKPGEIAALIGPNGSGKSTLANLILGFLSPERGEIYFDGHPIRDLDVKNIRNSISVLRQNPLFFRGTVAENLVYGREEKNDRLASSPLIQPWISFLADFPLGLNTPILDSSGAPFSGGHKQKLAIARALWRNGKLLILDEPTNHLDSSSLQLLFDSLDRWKEERGIVLISHDPSLVSYGNQISALRNR